MKKKPKRQSTSPKGKKKAPAKRPAATSKRKVVVKSTVAPRSRKKQKDISKETSLRLYQGMLRTHLFEERLHLLYRQGELFGGLYTGSGNEAVAVGAAACLEAGDVMAPSHRGIGAHFMRGETVRGMMLQLMARAEGGTQGRDNAAHQGSMERGILGMISHLAVMPALACGAALQHAIAGKSQVGLGFIGEGGTSLGDFHETMNLAAVLNLPFVMVIENNQWAYSTPTDKQYRCRSLSIRAEGYGIPGVTIDGTDVELVYRTVLAAAARARAGHGPTLIETITMRLRGHSAADMAEYVPEKMLQAARKNHPVEKYRKTLQKRGWLSPAAEKKLRSALSAEIEDAIAYAKQSAVPVAASCVEGVYAERPQMEEDTSEPSGEATTYLEAIRQALFEEMERDETVFCIGEDIAAFGGAFKVTKGLLERFGEKRVIDTPIAESGIVGLSVGAAMSGGRPVVEMQFADFVSNSFTQLVYNAATAHYRWQQSVPLVVRLPAGGGLNAGPFHSANPETWFFSSPGLTIVAPSTANDARGLLKAAIRDPNPVLFLEHKFLYRRNKEALRAGDGLVPIGKAKIARQGSQATVVTYGAYVHRAVEAAELLAKDGYDVEVIDLRTLKPWDKQLVLESVKRTSRLLILHESQKSGGLGGEIAAVVGEEAFEYLDAPVSRLASRDTPVPFAPTLEEFFMPQLHNIVFQLRALLEY